MDDSLKGNSSRPKGTSHHFVRWHSPPTEYIKLNFDGSLTNKSAAGGFILRDWTGKTIKAGTIHYGETSILVTEARALKNGVIEAIQAGYLNEIIEGDNNTVIRVLQGKTQTPGQIAKYNGRYQIMVIKSNQLLRQTCL